MSNGGLMSNVVACEIGDQFRAMVAMSGGGPTGYAMKPCVGQLAVWISHGNMDDSVPVSYGQASRDYWLKANHCGQMTVPVMPARACCTRVAMLAIRCRSASSTAAT
jgi:predicted esterase